MKQKDHNEVRYLKGEVRRLTKENRQLKKQIGYHDKRKHLFEKADEEISVEEQEAKEENVKKITCEACGKGQLVLFEIMNMCFGTCNVCSERVKLK